MSSTPTTPKKPGFLFIYWCMLLTSYLETFKYVFAVRALEESGAKHFGLLPTCILEVAKIIGSCTKLIACSLISLLLTTVWPTMLPFITLVTATLVYRRVRKQEAESEANTEKLSQELAGE